MLYFFQVYSVRINKYENVGVSFSGVRELNREESYRRQSQFRRDSHTNAGTRTSTAASAGEDALLI